MKIGEELIKNGVITEDQLNKALEQQKKEPKKKIGEILLELGFIDIENFTKILEKQLKEKGLEK